MSDWFNWTNFFYLAGLILAGGATFVGLRYKKLVDEINDVTDQLNFLKGRINGGGGGR